MRDEGERTAEGAASQGDDRLRSERRHWEDVSATAARDLPPGRIGGVIAQLRQRGRVANRRAGVFLGFLLATVALGLAYYIGLPLVKAYAEGTTRTWRDQVQAAETANAALDTRRAAAIAALKDALALAPEVVWKQGIEGVSMRLALADDTLIATGEYGTILRSIDAGKTWLASRGPSNAQEGEEIVVLALTDSTLIATTSQGTILRSTDRGATWPEADAPPVRGTLALKELADGTLIARGGDGESLRSTNGGGVWHETTDDTWTPIYGNPRALADGTLIARGAPKAFQRSTDGGASWHEYGALPETDERFGTPFVLADGTLVATDGGASWLEERAQSETGEVLDLLALSNGDLVAMEGDGTILRSTDSGATWPEVRARSETGEGFAAPLVLADGTLIATGDMGTILRSADGGATWPEVRARPETGEIFAAPLVLADGTLIATGLLGTILRSADGGVTWPEVRLRSETDEGFDTPLVLADGMLIATGANGTILRSADGGATWPEVRARSETDEAFDTPLALADGTLVATGDAGTILRLSGDTADRLSAAAVGLSPGGAGDAALLAFRDRLDSPVREAEPVAAALRALDQIATERVPVEAGLERARERLTAWASGEAAAETRRAAFAVFMEGCRAGAVEPDDAALTSACLDAYAAGEADTQRQWWESLVEQVPAGILLLFLLATLSGLYRYNVRLAGFHNGRADALELIVAQVDKDLLTPVADALAADKVEFGAAKTPTDHAAEMATALINRAKP